MVCGDRSFSTIEATLLPGATTMFDRLSSLPTEFDLPDTDDKPVDNELQILAPFLLRTILTLAWESRFDWFLGINLGVDVYL
jgi:hypothetical protein